MRDLEELRSEASSGSNDAPRRPQGTQIRPEHSLPRTARERRARRREERRAQRGDQWFRSGGNYWKK
jgi:hypothetical protein